MLKRFWDWLIKDIKSTRLKDIVKGALIIFPIQLIITLHYNYIFSKKLQSTSSSHFLLVENNDLDSYQIDVSQKSIDLAMKANGFKLPSSCAYPKLSMEEVYTNGDLNMADVVEAGIYNQRTVNIYPSAFYSWATLSSTLSHEIEVHCYQNFFWLSLKADMLRYSKEEKEALFELPAYRHELENSKRFKNDNDLESIKLKISLHQAILKDKILYDSGHN